MEQNNLERYNISDPKTDLPTTEFDRFKEQFGNLDFRISRMTYVSFAVIFLFVAQSFLGDPSELFANMNEALRLITYIVTIVFLWVLYGIIYFAVVRENTTVHGIGLVKLRLLDFAQGIFAVFPALILTALFFTIILSQFGLTIPGEVEMFLPQELTGKLLWVLMSITAGFCEEAVFRGYLMTRIRLLGKFNSWTVPVIVSSLLFGIPHLYQGFAGVVVITAIGALFGISYIYYKSIWPAVIAHFFLDFLNLFTHVFESWYNKIFG